MIGAVGQQNWRISDLAQRLLPGQPPWVHAAMVFICALVGAVVLHWLLFRILEWLARSSDSQSDNILVGRLERPTRWAIAALIIAAAAHNLPMLDSIWAAAARFVLPALIGWVALAILRALIETMALRADTTVENNLNARRKRTRLAIFSRIGSFIIVFVTVGLMLLAIPAVRDVGVTLVASAGLAGLAVGAAAQPALKSIIAGLQLALTEPIAIDDVVIVDGEWGWIEEIRTTYVVVKLWDWRRLIVPTSKFLEDIFQNWTRTNSELIGTVFIYLDPAANIAPIRDEYTRQIKAHRLWNRQAQILQVTDTKPDAIEIRLLMSAKDSPTLFDLRCEMREAMLAWIRDNQPQAIVRHRLLSPEPVIFTPG